MASMNTTTKDGTQIKVKGAGPEIPSTVNPPTNKQIDSMISGASNELEANKARLDDHGKEIASSTQNALEATSLLLNEKNKEERFQKLFLYTQGSAQAGPSEGLTKATRNLMTQATGMGSKISNDATDVLSYVRETVFNLTISGEFRQFAIEFLNLLQSMMGQLKTAIAETDNQTPLNKQKLKSRTFETDEDRLDDINEKLGIFLRHVGQQPQYRSVVSNFLKYSEEIYNVLYRAKEDSSKTPEYQTLRKTIDEGWEILNDFVGDNKRVPKFKKNLQGTLEKLTKDDQLIEWIKKCRKFLIDVMENPELVSKDQKQMSELIRCGGDLSDKYRNDFDRIYRDGTRIIDRIQSDPVIQNFQQSLEQLGKDIALNNKGQPDLFVLEKSMNVIRDLLVERFKKVLIDVPIKRVQVKNDSMDLVLTDITVEGNGLVPNNLTVELSSVSKFNFEKDAGDAAQRFRIRLAVDSMAPHFKGVKFDFEKTSFPSIKDHGTADIIFEGKGLSAEVAVGFIMKSNQVSRAVLETCTIDIEKVNLKIEEAKHDILGAMFAPLIQSRLKSRLQSVADEYIRGRIVQIIDQLNDWFATRPFETMMKKGNETIQTAMEKNEQKKDNSKRKFEEGKQESKNEQKNKQEKKQKLSDAKPGLNQSQPIKKDFAHQATGMSAFSGVDDYQRIPQGQESFDKNQNNPISQGLKDLKTHGVVAHSGVSDYPQGTSAVGQNYGFDGRDGQKSGFSEHQTKQATFLGHQDPAAGTTESLKESQFVKTKSSNTAGFNDDRLMKDQQKSVTAGWDEFQQPISSFTNPNLSDLHQSTTSAWNEEHEKNLSSVTSGINKISVSPRDSGFSGSQQQDGKMSSGLNQSQYQMKEKSSTTAGLNDHRSSGLGHQNPAVAVSSVLNDAELKHPLTHNETISGLKIGETGSAEPWQTQPQAVDLRAENPRAEMNSNFQKTTDATSGVGSADRINKLLDPNFVSQVKEQPSS